MDLDFTAFRARHRALIAELSAELLHPTKPGGSAPDSEAFAAALWRSVEKSGVREEKIAEYLRTLHIPDLGLAAACVAGSAAAWEIMLGTMRAPLRAAGRAMAGDRGEELADALFGELYAKRATKLASYAGRSSLVGWLRAVLHQTWIDRLRAEKRLVALEENGPEPAAPPAADTIEQAQNVRIVRGALDRALSALPPRQKLLLDYYYSHDLTLREAAALVGVHEATASRELDRARGALKSQLTAILRQEHGLETHAAETLLLESSGVDWGGAQDIASTNVLLKERS